MAKSKKPSPPFRTNDEIRRLMLQYFYDRNKNATSAFGKRGSAIKISDVKKELKVLIERWRRHYNTVRPHSSLGYRPPGPRSDRHRC